MLPFMYILLFLLGAAVGSFISVLVYRLHEEKKGIFRGRSECPQCQTTLTPFDLVPIASFLALRGQCRTCSKKISFMYPLLEIATGFVFMLLFIKFPFTDASLNFSLPFLGLYLLYAFYSAILIFTFCFDLQYYKVADEVLIPSIVVALVATLAYPYTPHIADALLGMILSTAFFGLQIVVSQGAWLGRGDLRVGAFMGAILGWKLLIVALFAAYLLGSIISIFIVLRTKKIRGVKVPFAPFLVTGTFFALFFGEQVVQWYLGGVL